MSRWPYLPPLLCRYWSNGWAAILECSEGPFAPSARRGNRALMALVPLGTGTLAASASSSADDGLAHTSAWPRCAQPESYLRRCLPLPSTEQWQRFEPLAELQRCVLHAVVRMMYQLWCQLRLQSAICRDLSSTVPGEREKRSRPCPMAGSGAPPGSLPGRIA
jgi:hypothetical protein